MGFRKKDESRDVTTARQRLSGMKLIDTTKGRIINYGDIDKPLTQAELEAKINEYAAKMEEYNQLLSQADQKSNEMDVIEDSIRELYTSVLKAAAAKFGTDASEIEQLGGTRRSDRQSPIRKNKLDTAAE